MMTTSYFLQITIIYIIRISNIIMNQPKKLENKNKNGGFKVVFIGHGHKYIEISLIYDIQYPEA